MIVLFAREFVHSFHNLTAADQKKASPFVIMAQKELQNVPGPANFQSLPFAIAMEVTTKLYKYLGKKVSVDPNDAVFSITDGVFVMLFLVNAKKQGTAQIWCIKRLKP